MSNLNRKNIFESSVPLISHLFVSSAKLKNNLLKLLSHPFKIFCNLSGMSDGLLLFSTRWISRCFSSLLTDTFKDHIIITNFTDVRFFILFLPASFTEYTILSVFILPLCGEIKDRFLLGIPWSKDAAIFSTELKAIEFKTFIRWCALNTNVHWIGISPIMVNILPIFAMLSFHDLKVINVIDGKWLS